MGNRHTKTLSVINNLKSQGKLEEAIPLFQETLDSKRASLDDTNPKTLTLIGNLAALLSQQGRPEQAEPLCAEVLVAYRNTFGDHHHKTVTAMCKLASAKLAQGKHS